MRHLFLLWGSLFLLHPAFAADKPVTADPLPPLQTLNTPRTFPVIDTKEAWQERAREIREQILVSCGLWPMPEKTPLQPKIFGRIERDGYTVEKVYLQTHPGFYLGGNLYRPRGRGNGPFPAILNPHGHWAQGRFADNAEGSIAARCINFARQGMIAFSYDMVGYNDTRFSDWPAGADAYKTHRRFATNEVNLLWNISLMGLQTWNSIRALDFLESLPDADKSRLACTGESGGGTQTFMLGAVDDRLAAQAPVVMVSHSMQGGCLCENVAGLRVEYSNMEIAAAAAPRPQIAVGATGDWTRMMLTVEGPAIEKIYSLFGAADHFRYVRFHFNHNYNETSREAVYDFFGHWLRPAAPSSKESEYKKEPDADLRVFPDNQLPAGAISEKQLIASLKKSATDQWRSSQPKDKESLEKYQKTYRVAWDHTFQIIDPHAELRVDSGEWKTNGNYVSREYWLGRDQQSKRIPALLLRAPTNVMASIVVLVHPKGKSSFLHAGQPIGLAKQLIDRGEGVVLLDLFLTGDLANDEAARARRPFVDFFSAYNRTDLQERILDLALACEFARTRFTSPRVTLCGQGRAGLWTLLAAPMADAVVADCDDLNTSQDEAFLSPDLFAPGIRSIGGFEGVAALAAPHPLLLHNASDEFSTQWLRQVYKNVDPKKSLSVDSKKESDAQIVKWIAAQK